MLVNEPVLVVCSSNGEWHALSGHCWTEGNLSCKHQNGMNHCTRILNY